MRLNYKNTLITSAILLLCIFILLYVAFYFFPLLGHDYSYVVPNSLEFNIAWNNFGVLNPHYSPMRCLGLPMWANPISANFSFLHLYSLFTEPKFVIALYISTFAVIAFYGAYFFSTLFFNDFLLSLLFSVGWTLQAHFVSNVIVGHTSYMVVSFFPFIFFLILKKHNSKIKEIFFFALLVFLVLQIVFSGAHSAPFIFISSSVICLFSLFLLGYNFKDLISNIKYLLIRNIIAAIVVILMSLPKLLAVMSWLSKYPRKISFMNVGITRVLEYSYYNLLIPTPFDAKTSVDWWYGNWESNQGIFPSFIILLILFLFFKKRFRPLIALLIFITGIFIISVLINSGFYAGLFSKIPVLNSLHVNPRWNTIILLPLFAGLCFIVKKHAYDLNRYLVVFFFIAFLGFPFLFINIKQNEISYMYMQGYNPSINRLNYCYEPVFGYTLEYFPKKALQYNLYGPDLVDPRCYLKDATCEPGTLINKVDLGLLETFKLQ